MSISRKTKAGLIAVGATALVFAIPAVGQSGPESLLPEGFGDPPPPSPPPPPAATSTPPPSSSQTRPSASAPSSVSSTSAPAVGDVDKDAEDTLDEEPKIKFDVPAAARRSLKQVGIISEASGGLPVAAFGKMDGAFLKRALVRTKGPLASRWGSIMARRMLVSRSDTPENVNGADWVAERAWLLLNMGDAVTARQLVQQVDAGRYTTRLQQVAMQAFLANADLAGMCPVTETGLIPPKDGYWNTARAICASLSGEQGAATSFLNQARNRGWVKGIDYRLTEKAVGAGMNGRRSVKIEWEGVEQINPWRFGLASATGLEMPDRLYQGAGRYYDGWRAELPMMAVASRIKAAPGAAALGSLSNRDMVDLYAQAFDDADIEDAIRTRADLLQNAYVADSDGGKVSAMASLWDGAKAGSDYQGMLILTARAAALIAPNETHEGQADRLIASMFSAGFDRSAARWASIVPEGSLGWGLLAVGAPRGQNVAYGALDDFAGNDYSEAYHKSALLLAGLAGLGRVDAEAIADFSDDVDANVRKETRWSRAIQAAARRGESGTVAVLAAAGMQTSDWTKMPAHHLYHIVRALREVGMDAEARMIAAEAVTFG